MDEQDETQRRPVPGSPAGEGIRIIGPDEAAAVEKRQAFARSREDAARRAGFGELSSEPRPVHRFPRPYTGDEAGSPLPPPSSSRADEHGIDLTQPLLTPPGSSDPAETSALSPRSADLDEGPSSGTTLTARRRRTTAARKRSTAGTRSVATGLEAVRGVFRRTVRAQASSDDAGPDGAASAERQPTRGAPAAVAEDRGPASGEGTGSGPDGDVDDWVRGRPSPSADDFELADFGSSEEAEETGRFRSQPPPAPPSRGGRHQSPRAASPRSDRAQGADLTNRILTGMGIGFAAIILFKLGSLTSLVLVLLVVMPAAAELFAVLRRAGYRPATLVGLVATVGILIGAYMKGEAAIPLVLGLMVVFTLLWYLLGVERARPTVNVGVTLLAFMWVGFLASFAALLLDPRMFPNRHGVALLLGAAVTTVAYDVGSYLVGARFGRHRLAPSISPNKTWEGLIGGTAASVLVGAVVVSQISPWNTARGVALGLVVAVAAPLGDLCESLFKRDIGVKDMGSILPGHGGVLDRVDALLFVVPATFYLVRLINFGG